MIAVQEPSYERDRYEVSDAIRETHRSTAADVVSRDRYGHLIDGEWGEAVEDGECLAIDATTGDPSRDGAGRDDGGRRPRRRGRPGGVPG